MGCWLWGVGFWCTCCWWCPTTEQSALPVVVEDDAPPSLRRVRQRTAQLDDCPLEGEREHLFLAPPERFAPPVVGPELLREPARDLLPRLRVVDLVEEGVRLVEELRLHPFQLVARHRHERHLHLVREDRKVVLVLLRPAQRDVARPRALHGLDGA